MGSSGDAPAIDLRSLREDVVEGVFFSIAGSATTIYNDIDKIMLSRLADLAATGVYAAAYRVDRRNHDPRPLARGGRLPAVLPQGTVGLAATYPYARSLIAKTSLYGLLASAGLWVLAPVLPHVLGTKYEAVVPAVRWLALIPLLRSIHSFLADSLSGAGYQRTRTGIQVLVALLNVVSNLIILPRYSWRGAAWTSVGCDGLLVILFWVTVHYRHRVQQFGTVRATVSGLR